MKQGAEQQAQGVASARSSKRRERVTSRSRILSVGTFMRHAMSGLDDAWLQRLLTCHIRQKGVKVVGRHGVMGGLRYTTSGQERLRRRLLTLCLPKAHSVQLSLLAGAE